MTPEELAVQKASLSADSCSKDEELPPPKSPPLGESNLSRLETGQAPSQHSPGQAGGSTIRETSPEGERGASTLGRHVFRGVSPASMGGSGRFPLKQMLRS